MKPQPIAELVVLLITTQPGYIVCYYASEDARLWIINEGIKYGNIDTLGTGRITVFTNGIYDASEVAEYLRSYNK